MKALCLFFLAACGQLEYRDPPRHQYHRNPTQDAVDNLNQQSRIFQNASAQYRPTNCTTQAVPFSYPTMYRTTCN